MSENKIKTLQLATFAAGCFWGVEESFRKIKGVKSTMVGYTGGRWENPTYNDVCADLTGHAEAIQLQYDPQEVSYEICSKCFGQFITQQLRTDKDLTMASSIVL